MNRLLLVSVVASLVFSEVAFGEDPVKIHEPFQHIRNTEQIEWDSFPDKATASQLLVTFDVANPEKFTLLTLRQRETKQLWKVTLNGSVIGSLPRDHNHLEHGIAIPTGLLRSTGNQLEIKTDSTQADDIEIGDIQLHKERFRLGDPQTIKELRGKRGYYRAIPQMAARIAVGAVDDETGSALPCRFTIIDRDMGALAFVGAESNDVVAVREGVVYSLSGGAKFALAGSDENPRRYSLFCGRGFEYGLERFDFEINDSANSLEHRFSLRREVDTSGLVACDPHLHTYEHDRHGDCTLTERLISAAGEGVELPISTAHDKHIEFATEAKRISADLWFTPVTGCEVTTHLGHFNIFPVGEGAAPVQHKLRPWDRIFTNIYSTPKVRVCILNHGRDVHRGFTPLAPENFDVETGTFLHGRDLRANAMELINSGAQQTDPLELVRDWFALAKSGHKVAGIGSSDSHTVNFAIPGQARTYLPADDSDVGAIDVDAATASLASGNSLTCFGLLCQVLHDKASKETRVVVSGPGWTQLETLRLFRNGEKVRTMTFPEKIGKTSGIKFETSIPLSDWDARPGDFLCAVASGPGITEPWWPMMPPYQPDSTTFTPFVMGISSLVRIP